MKSKNKGKILLDLLVADPLTAITWCFPFIWHAIYLKNHTRETYNRWATFPLPSWGFTIVGED